MTENNTDKDTNKYLFINLVTMLSLSAMQQMGKIINPATGQAELSLAAAQATIDMLDMLAARTKGNLAADEEKLMRDTLAMLKMNFVETSAETKKPQSDKGPEAQSGSEKSEQKSDAEPGKDPKFHKSYGG